MTQRQIDVFAKIIYEEMKVEALKLKSEKIDRERSNLSERLNYQ